MGRKHYRKRRNCSLRAISPFPTVFSKGMFPRGRQKVSSCGNGLKAFSLFPQSILRPFYFGLLSVSQTSPGLCVSSTCLLKTQWEKRYCSQPAISPFSHSLFYRLENFVPFSSNFKLSAANSFSL